MSRPIQFRAWQGHSSLDRSPGMYVVQEIHWYDELDNGKTGEVFFVGHTSSEYIEDVELMQFTGLTDKNGKEIYEGDIVQVTNSYYGDYNVEVEFIDGAFGYHEIKAKQVKNPDAWDKEHDAVESNGFHIVGNKAFWERVRFKDSKLPEQYEVIGNIMENPELLTTNKEAEQ